MEKITIKDQKRKELARVVRNWNIYDFYDTLVKENIYRLFIVYDNGEFILSHPKLLAPLQAFFELSQDFSAHEGVFIGREENIDTLFFAFVHDTRRGLAQGGLRFAGYPNLAEILIDGLRLSQGMTRKNALAGLSWGGGKGIMVFPKGITATEQLKKGSSERRKYFEGYGRFIASLGGIYYTAEDVGTNTDDMQAVLSQNRFTTCIPVSAGGSGNPSPFTAKGVLRGMQAAWKVISGSEDLRDVKVAVQGAGNVGYPLIKYLYELGAKIYFCDISAERCEELKKEMPLLTAVELEEIYDLDADIFSPCARGASVNSGTIPRLKVKLVCGAANNILREPEEDAKRLKEKGILFVPDFVCNRMGIINCADEWYGYLEEDSLIAADRVFPDTLRVFKYAKNRGTTTTQAAIDLADIAASELHPVIGHRGMRLIDHLIQSGWQNYPEQIRKNKSNLAFVPAIDEGKIKLSWQRKDFNQGQKTIAASPVPAAATPDLSSFLSPLLLDIQARAEEKFGGIKVKRVMGSNHGGLSLQIAIEQATPYERREIGRTRFMEMCHDLHANNDEEIRKQLHLLGVGFDHHSWLNPMDESGRYSVDSLYRFMKNGKLLTLQDWILNFCPSCQTVLVSSDVKRSPLKVENRYHLKFSPTENEVIETSTFFPEYLLDAVALAVKTGGKYSQYIGHFVLNPAKNNKIPVIGVEDLSTEATFISPLFSFDDEKIARENGVLILSQLFDDQGKICSEGFENLYPEETYPLLEKKFANQMEIEKGEWEISSQRCKRCESMLIPRLSKQLFVNFEEAKKLLNYQLNEKNVTFSEPKWEKHFRSVLDKIDVWCISRQYWWGNYVPDSLENDKSWVFSTWFSLVAMALQGAGWPENPKISTIDEVYVDPDYLIRWVLPAQLVSLLVTGRPVFKNINVHGSLQVIERMLKPNKNFAADIHDEERFSFTQIRRPMQKRLGNVTEPISLISRFGADSLRLGYLLNLRNGFQREITASQTNFRLARKALFRLNTKTTNILHLLKKAKEGNKNSVDEQILERISLICQKAKDSYLNKDYYAVANLFIKVCGLFSDYCNQVSIKYNNSDDPGAAINTIPEVIKNIRETFDPVCPFILEKLETWVISQKKLISG